MSAAEIYLGKRKGAVEGYLAVGSAGLFRSGMVLKPRSGWPYPYPSTASLRGKSYTFVRSPDLSNAWRGGSLNMSDAKALWPKRTGRR